MRADDDGVGVIAACAITYQLDSDGKLLTEDLEPGCYHVTIALDCRKCDKATYTIVLPDSMLVLDLWGLIPPPVLNPNPQQYVVSLGGLSGVITLEQLIDLLGLNIDDLLALLAPYVPLLPTAVNYAAGYPGGYLQAFGGYDGGYFWGYGMPAPSGCCTEEPDADQPVPNYLGGYGGGYMGAFGAYESGYFPGYGAHPGISGGYGDAYAASYSAAA